MMGHIMIRVKIPWLNYIVLTLLAFLSIGPLLTLFFNSFKETGEIAINLFGPQLTGFRWLNYVDAWVQGKFATTMRNSGILAAGTIFGTLIVSGLGAYALSRLRVPGSDILTLYLIVGTTIPAQLFMVPLFFLWQKLGLINNLLGLVIIYTATHSPFATFLLRSYFLAIPREFDEAAKVDGANDAQVLWYVLIPLSWPGFLTVALVTGLAAWNEFLFAVTFLHKAELKPISTSLYAFTTQYYRDWGLTSAAAVIMIFPALALFLIFQRRFIEGLTQGGLRT